MHTCYNHPEIESDYQCGICGKDCCQDCIYQGIGICRGCVYKGAVVVMVIMVISSYMVWLSLL